jgi:hypothetical protein
MPRISILNLKMGNTAFMLILEGDGDSRKKIRPLEKCQSLLFMKTDSCQLEALQLGASNLNTFL